MNAASELIDAMLRTSTRITTLSAEHSIKAQDEELTMWGARAPPIGHGGAERCPGDPEPGVAERGRDTSRGEEPMIGLLGVFVLGVFTGLILGSRRIEEMLVRQARWEASVTHQLTAAYWLGHRHGLSNLSLEVGEAWRN